MMLRNKPLLLLLMLLVLVLSAIGCATARRRADTLAHAAASRDPTLADGSPSGATAIDLLAYMLGRTVDRAAALAGIADRARIAGLTCERAYDEVRGLRWPFEFSTVGING